jgi:hypothetical protein
MGTLPRRIKARQPAPVKIIGIVSHRLRVAGLAMGSFSYTKETHRSEDRPLQLSVQEKDSVNIPQWLGIAAIVAGVLMLVVPARSRKGPGAEDRARRLSAGPTARDVARRDATRRPPHQPSRRKSRAGAHPPKAAGPPTRWTRCDRRRLSPTNPPSRARPSRSASCQGRDACRDPRSPPGERPNSS